jgi:hypothetical protein
MIGSMGHLVILAILIAFVIWAITIWTIMLLSPELWFRLPEWMAYRGTMTERKYGRTTWGRLQVRLVGAISLGLILRVIWDAVTHWIRHGH